MPICSLAAATARSMPATSGRRSISVDGRPAESPAVAWSPAWAGSTARRRLADEGRDGVFELRAPDADVDELRAGRLQLCFGLCDIGARRDAGGEPILGQLQRLSNSVTVRRNRSASASRP